MPTKKIEGTENADNLSNQTQDTESQEQPQTQEPQEQSQKTGVLIQGVYATEYFKRNGIPYCSLCGEQYHNEYGNPICPENLDASVCPRLQ